MIHLLVVTMQVAVLLSKYCRVDTIGPRYSKMHMSLFVDVINFRDKDQSPNTMRCQCPK